MKTIELKVGEYVQQQSVSCLAASALIGLNYIDSPKWPLTPEKERALIENIQFDAEHPFGCYPKLIDFLASQGYKVTFLLGSVPKERDSEERRLYDIWMEYYNRINSPERDISIKFVRRAEVLPVIEEVINEKKVPIIFYSARRWHNLVLHGKLNQNEYHVFDPASGRKVFNYTLLQKNMLSPWGINAIYIENGTRK